MSIILRRDHSIERKRHNKALKRARGVISNLNLPDNPTIPQVRDAVRDLRGIERNIHIYPMHAEDRWPGNVIHKADAIFVFYDGDMDRRLQFLSILHELGHLAIGHAPTPASEFGRVPDGATTDENLEAELFARLLAERMLEGEEWEYPQLSVADTKWLGDLSESLG